MLSGVSTELSQNSVLSSGYIPRNKDKINKSINYAPQAAAALMSRGAASQLLKTYHILMTLPLLTSSVTQM
jgi:hypothetical protein